MRGSLVAWLILISPGLVIASPQDARAATRQQPQGTQELSAVSLPDLSGLPASVQKQLREAHASVVAVLERPALAPAAAADAFGNLGKLFMATQFSVEAERSLQCRAAGVSRPALALLPRTCPQEQGRFGLRGRGVRARPPSAPR
jgi:hypothetical protein